MSVALEQQSQLVTRHRARTLRHGAPYLPQVATGSLLALALSAFVAAAGLGDWLAGGFHAAAVPRAVFWSASLPTGWLLVSALHRHHLLDAGCGARPGGALLRIAGYALLTLILVACAAALVLGWHAGVLLWLIASLALAVPMLRLLDALYRGVVKTLAARGLVAHHIAVVGGGPDGSALLAAIARHRSPLIRVVGVFDDRARDPARRVSRHVSGVPVRGTTRDLIAFARRVRIDSIFIALPWRSAGRVSEVLGTLRPLPANVYLGPDRSGLAFMDSTFTSSHGLPVFFLSRSPVDGWGHVLKRLFDVAFSLCALIGLAPLLLLIALAVRIDSRGPVLFSQRRYGFNNRLIKVYKFRSMYHHARDADATRLAVRDDPRVTRVGRFLRRTSLDELPQFLNVLRGEMSVVGPRPHALGAKAAGRLYQDVVADYALRHRIKPGLTGWAQVHGWRGETDTAEKVVRRVEHDLYYIEHWSFALDLYIVARTVVLLPFQRNAY